VPLAEEIRRRLREQILSGRLAPGERVMEVAVARQMGTSPGPVREAIASLCREGLLISLPHRGAFVSEVSEDEARIVYAIRERLEPYAVELAMQHLTDEALADLAEDVERMCAAAAENDLATVSRYDTQFHGRLYTLSGSSTLSTIWLTIEGKVRKFVAVAAPQYIDDLKPVAELHRRYLQLMRGGDLAALRTEAAEHPRDIWRRISSS
jgi:DNA-binding GntR family transcriptional regulator